MRFLLLVPGSGHFYCGSCLRDMTLARGLQQLGHEVTVAPLYLPHVLEDEAANGAAQPPLHMGGINMYLQQKSRLLGRLPRWLKHRLDSPWLLRWASRRSGMTAPHDLGAMTVSMLRGEEGRQARELDDLVAWARTIDRPDVVVLSQVLLVGLVRRLKQALDCPIAVTLQGEAPFLDGLPAPWSARAWDELRRRAADVDRFVAVSRYYGDLMAERLGLRPDRLSVVWNGIDVADFAADPEPCTARRPRTVGYLARLCRDKGLHTLVEAFVLLRQDPRFADLKLRAAGVVLREDQAYVRDLVAKLEAHGLRQDAELLANVDRPAKLAFLHTLSVLSVPATYGESFGLYVLEALASGVPVVEPRHAAFPEIVEATGGGVLCAPDDPSALAAAIGALLDDPVRAERLAAQGRQSVRERFTAERMAAAFAAACGAARAAGAAR